MERTRIQAFKELRSLLSEVLASAVADEQVPEAFKSVGNWERLIAQTEQRLEQGWKQRFDADPQRRRKASDGSQLDLVPEEEVGQQLLSERFVNDVSHNVRDPLDQLDRQLAAMSGDGFDDRSANPLAPTAWVEGLRGGIREIHATPAEREWLMERLVALLSARMGYFYYNLTSRQHASGVVVAPRRRAYGRGGMAPGLAGGGGGGQEYRPELVESLVAPLPTGASDGAGDAPVDEGAAVLDRLFGLLSARRGPDAYPMGHGGPAGVAGGDVGMGGYAAPGFGGMPGQVLPPGYMAVPAGAMPMAMPMGGLPMVGVPMGGVPMGMPYPNGAPVGDGLPGGGFAAPMAPVTPWSQADIFSILALMQSNSAGPGLGAGVALGRLQEAISQTAAQLGLQGAAQQAMPAQAQDMLELVSMLFDALLDGRRLDKKARSQLSSLVVPYVRVAMLDRRMFMQGTHPARRVLNQLVEAFETAGPDVPHYGTLRDLGFRTIERVLHEFNDDLALFEQLEADLAGEIDACRKRAELAERRAAKAQDGKERRQAARESVADWLVTAIGRRRIPPALMDFLCGRWQHHHNMVLLREGEAGDGVQANRGLLRDLLRCHDRRELGDAALLRPRLEAVLASSGQPPSAVDDLLAELALAFALQAGDERSASQVAEAEVAQAAALASLTALPKADADAADDEVPVPAVAPESLPADRVEHYANAPIGTWLDFVGDDGRITSSRISWTSPISGKRILSNRRGQRILVASPEELAAMEAEGRLKPRNAEAAFDVALNAIAEKLEAAGAVR
jgi:hypothetical protein